MGSAVRELNVLFLPYFTPSHLLPLVDIARLFAKRGVNATIVSTPSNSLLFQTFVNRDIAAGHPIKVHNLKFPVAEAGLPEGIEHFGAITSMEMLPKISTAVQMLREPVELLIRKTRPDCIVSDTFYTWTVDIAEELQIPRIVLNPSNFFFHCINHCLKTYAPHENIKSETETFVIPGLPDKIEITKSQLSDYAKTNTGFAELMEAIAESELRSYGTIVHSFNELEHSYMEYFKTVLGRKGWGLGPLCLFSADREKTNKPNNSITGQHSCLSWLDTQKPNSVLYVCFGSIVRFPDSQLTEIALALEASDHPFVWVVRKTEKTGEENWLPEGFVERNYKGLIIREWAPQVLILEHPAIGGFMTHCGWNSVMESVTTGVPLITWPLFAEQFYNEKLITQVFKIGIGVGSEVWNFVFEIASPVVGKDKIEKAVTFLMTGSQEVEKIRRRAKELSEMAKKAVEEAMAPGGRGRRPAMLSQPPSSHSEQNLATPVGMGSSQPVTPTTETTTSTSRRKGRGKAKNIALIRHIEATGQRVRIEILEGMKRPINGWNKWFVAELGIICRTYAPVTCKDWSEVNEDQLKILYNHILEKFDIDLDVPHVKFAVDDYLKDRFKDYRHKIHKYFKRLGSYPIACDHPFDGISHEDWENICKHYMTDNYQKRSKINTENRKKLVVNHYGGSKSFSQYREALRHEETGEKYGMIEFYEHMHYRPGKGWTHPKAKESHDLMVAEQSTPVPEGSTRLSEEQICEKVLGKKPGYVLGLGHGVCPPSSSRSSQRNRAEVERANQRAEESEKRAEEFRHELHTQQSQLQEVLLRQSQLEAQIQALLASASGNTPPS